MIIRNVTFEDLDRALEQLNKKYQNIIWNRFEQTAKTTYAITLRVVSSHGLGSRLGQSIHTSKKGKEFRVHLINACWHVYGDFFDTLLNINPKAVITTAMARIYVNEYGQIVGNWSDRNIGSMMEPLSYSEACDCNNVDWSSEKVNLD